MPHPHPTKNPTKAREGPYVPAESPAGGCGNLSRSARPTGPQRAVHGVRRRYVIPLPVSTSLLRVGRQSRDHYADLREEVRHAADYALWVERAAPPEVHQAHVTLWIVPPDRRRRKPARWSPSALPAVEGLMDAGVLAPAATTTTDVRLTTAEIPGSGDHPTLHIPGVGHWPAVIPAGGQLLIVARPC